MDRALEDGCSYDLQHKFAVLLAPPSNHNNNEYTKWVTTLATKEILAFMTLEMIVVLVNVRVVLYISARVLPTAI